MNKHTTLLVTFSDGTHSVTTWQREASNEDVMRVLREVLRRIPGFEEGAAQSMPVYACLACGATHASYSAEDILALADIG